MLSSLFRLPQCTKEGVALQCLSATQLLFLSRTFFCFTTRISQHLRRLHPSRNRYFCWTCQVQRILKRQLRFWRCCWWISGRLNFCFWCFRVVNVNKHNTSKLPPVTFHGCVCMNTHQYWLCLDPGCYKVRANLFWKTWKKSVWLCWKEKNIYPMKVKKWRAQTVFSSTERN